MVPVIALVGRPNVGKSTIFNKLTRTRDALVANYPGLTRDRKYGAGKVGERDYTIIDTGGLSGEEENIDGAMAKQTRLAIDEADALVLVVDARDGLTAADENIAQELRRQNKPIYLVVNKIDRTNADEVQLEFASLGFNEPILVAAAHNRGMRSMMEAILAHFPENEDLSAEQEQDVSTRIAVVGRPNVGKSTLINRLLGEERVLAFDEPGTTRDSVFIPFEKDEKPYTLIDTAGVRRRGKVRETVEKFSVVKTLQAIEAANVVVLVVDAHQGVAEQDLHLLGFVLEAGRAVVIAINKWDGLDKEVRQKVKDKLNLSLQFIDFAKLHFISALHGTGVGHLLESVDQAYEAALRKMSTASLTRSLEAAVTMHNPPMIKGRRIKMRYAHQGGSNPPIIVIHGNQLDKLPGSYLRYLENFFRKEYKLFGTPVRLELKTSDNPFEGIKRNESKLQQRIRNVKRKQRTKKYGSD